MLQDLETGRLENEFYNKTAGVEDGILCFHQGQVLLCRDSGDGLALPTLGQLGKPPQTPPRYLFRMQDRNYFLWTDAIPDCPEGFGFEPVRQLRQLKNKEICFAVMTGWHLYNWYRNNRLCGC